MSGFPWFSFPRSFGARRLRVESMKVKFCGNGRRSFAWRAGCLIGRREGLPASGARMNDTSSTFPRVGTAVLNNRCTTRPCMATMFKRSVLRIVCLYSVLSPWSAGVLALCWPFICVLREGCFRGSCVHNGQPLSGKALLHHGAYPSCSSGDIRRALSPPFVCLLSQIRS